MAIKIGDIVKFYKTSKSFGYGKITRLYDDKDIPSRNLAMLLVRSEYGDYEREFSIPWLKPLTWWDKLWL